MQNSIKIWSATKKNKKSKWEIFQILPFALPQTTGPILNSLCVCPYDMHVTPAQTILNHTDKGPDQACSTQAQPKLEPGQTPRPNQTQAKAQTKAPARGDAVAAQIFSFFLLRVRMVWCDDGVDEGRGDYRGDRVRE